MAEPGQGADYQTQSTGQWLCQRGTVTVGRGLSLKSNRPGLLPVSVSALLAECG